MIKVTEAEMALIQRIKALTGRSNIEGLDDCLLNEAGRELALRLCRRSILSSYRWRGRRWFRCGRLAGQVLRAGVVVPTPQPPPYRTIDDIPNGVKFCTVASGKYAGQTVEIMSGIGKSSVVGNLASGEEVVVLARLLRPRGAGK